MASLLVNGLEEVGCHLCKEIYALDRDGLDKSRKKLATVHHLFFPAKLFQYPARGITTEERKFLRRTFRDNAEYQAVLCMHKNGDGIKGCHDLLNQQLSSGCLGIKSKHGSEDSKGPNNNLCIGKCPLIFGTKPKNSKVIIPNELCEFCFFFQFLCDPQRYSSAITIMNKIDNFEGDVTFERIYEAQRRLRQEGYEITKTAYPIGLVKGSYITRYKPVLPQPIILAP